MFGNREICANEQGLLRSRSIFQTQRDASGSGRQGGKPKILLQPNPNGHAADVARRRLNPMLGGDLHEHPIGKLFPRFVRKTLGCDQDRRLGWLLAWLT